jgi:hypothetical protein
MRLIVLDHLAQSFELGERYSEPMVNLILGQWHPDTAAWRRYLVDEGFLSRDHGVYWRTGGSVDVGDGGGLGRADRRAGRTAGQGGDAPGGC